MRTLVAAALVGILVGCGGASQSLANAPEFDLPARSFGNPAEVDSFGESVGLATGGVAVGAPSENGGASSAGQVHLFDPATGVLRRTLESPRPVRDGAFGAAIAIVGDGLLVGAPGENRVYLFDGSGTLLRTFEGPDGEDFGAAVAVVDGIAVIGAPRRNVGQGAAYFRDVATGADRGRVLSPTPAFSGAFGRALAAVAGDVLVGAPGEQDGVGAAHRIAVPTGQVKVSLRGPGGRLGDAFGEAVAGAAGDLLVGAPGEGAAYVFAADGSLRHVLANPEDGALFGLAVSYADGHLMVAALKDGATVYLFSAFNGLFERKVAVGDGLPGAVSIAAHGGIALIGIPAGGDAQRGLATTMNCDTGAIEQEFESPDPGQFNEFGEEVAILANGRLAVAEGGDSGDDGAVHVFEPDGTLVTTFLPPTAGTGGEFGSDLAALGDLVVISERSANDGDGAVYVADPDTESILLTILAPDGPGSGGGFGEAVEVVDGKIVVGEPFGGDGEVFPGKAYTFNTNGVIVHTLEDPDGFDGGEFGAAVGGAGTDYLVGSPFNRIVYCFDGSTGQEKQSYVPDILTGTSEGEDHFGAAVAGNDEEVWVGAPDATVFDPQGTLFAAGQVYVFNKSTGARLDLLASPRPTGNGFFGESISIEDDLVAISASGESSELDPQLQGTEVIFNDGLVYVYDRVRRLSQARVASPNGVEDGGFGDDAHIVGGVLAVGATGETAGAFSPAGKAYTFNTAAFGPTFSDFPEQDGAYGASIDGIDDRRALVGAPQQNNGNGDAYIMNTETNVAEVAMQNSTLGPSGFGLAVARLGNGLFAIGAPFDSGVGTVRICNGIGAEVAVIGNQGVQGFGFSLAAVGSNRLLIGAPAITNLTGTVEGNGFAYLYEVDDSGQTVITTLVHTLESPIGAASDEFGWSVAAFGDDLLVGAPGQNDDEGAAYLFGGTDGALLAPLGAPSPVSGERFGTAVTRMRNGSGANEALVGAPGAACTVYRFSAGGTFIQAITDPDQNPVSGFGFSLKGTIDFRFFVGAPNGLQGQGIVYEMNGNGVVFNEFESLNPSLFGLFGFAVSFLPAGTVPLVGAPGEDVNPSRAGRAYRFGFRFQPPPPPPPPPPPDDTVTFEAPNPTAGDGFGTQVAFSGTRVLVSAPCANSGSGEVYVYDGTTGALLDTIMNPAGTGSPDKFGCSLAANAMMIVVGASEADRGANGSGAAYLFSAETRALLLTFDLDDPQVDGGHGKASGVSSANIVVGEPFADVSSTLSGLGQPDAGRAYIYDCRVSTIIQALVSPNPQVLGLFGCCVHIDGSNVYVAACGENGAEGRVYGFDLVSGQLLTTILPPTAQSGQFFGTSCRPISGNLIVGAPGFDEDQLAGTSPGDEGIVYVINPSTGALLKTLRSGSPVPGGLFGTSVATNGTTIIVGAPGEAGGDGRVYVFDAATCALLATLTPPSGITGGNMGVSVAAMADNVLAGAPTASNAAGAAILNPPEEEEEP